MTRKPRGSSPPHPTPDDDVVRAAKLRIVGGTLRGRSIEYSGDLRTRPMKDRVREAVFNLLGPGVKGTLAIDLFAGTGALGIEAISRGASRAIFIERRFPTADLIRKNLASLGVGDRGDVSAADTFLWFRMNQVPTTLPWVIFCSPPYDFYVEREAEMVGLLQYLYDLAPPGSLFAVECDERFPLDRLPQSSSWQVRTYPPAVIAILRLAGPTLS